MNEPARRPEIPLDRSRSPAHASRAGVFCVVAILALPGWSCGPLDREEDVAERDIEEVQEAYGPEWMELPGVVGTGIGDCDGTPCIRVYLSAPSPEAEEAIPDSVEGHPVELVVTGPFRPRPPGDDAPPSHR